MATFRHRLGAAIASATTIVALIGGAVAPSAHAIKIPAPNKQAQVSNTTVLMDGEGNPCRITGLIKQDADTSYATVEPGCGSPVRPLMGAYKYVKNGGESYEQVAAREAGAPIPHYTKEEVLISYGLKQPVYIKGDRDTGIVGYLVLQIPDVGSVVELHAQYVK